jgi:hypothetical protein
MAESKSDKALSSWKNTAGEGYIAHLVYAFRSFELQPTDQSAAARLLSMIPPTSQEESLWYSLDGFLCKEEQDEEITVLAKLHARMPRDISKAVLLVPAKLRDYISYAFDSVQDPESDYAVQMQAVCRGQHKAFLAAVNSLSVDNKRWFVTKIFNPDACRAIAVPEAD